MQDVPKELSPFKGHANSQASPASNIDDNFSSFLGRLLLALQEILENCWNINEMKLNGTKETIFEVEKKLLF